MKGTPHFSTYNGSYNGITAVAKDGIKKYVHCVETITQLRKFLATPLLWGVMS